MSIFLIILIGILSVLALPSAIKERSWCRFFIAFVLSFVGVVLPLFVFFFSTFLGPEWKGDCPYGWLDCFIVGKLALTPVALFATVALYALEIYRVQERTRRWIVAGICLGAITASICFVYGMVCIVPKADALRMWMLVPFYVSVWYSIRAVQLTKQSGCDFRPNFISLVGSLPFWLASWYWSLSLYESLPNTAPSDCFIVTAAGHGHAKFVGPHFEVEHRGRKLLANHQLLTLWQFEDSWQRQAPRTHRIFRRAYNRIGPLIAGRIKSPWLADVAYLAIKPIELAAKAVVAAPNKSKV